MWTVMLACSRTLQAHPDKLCTLSPTTLLRLIGGIWSITVREEKSSWVLLVSVWLGLLAVVSGVVGSACDGHCTRPYGTPSSAPPDTPTKRQPGQSSLRAHMGEQQISDMKYAFSDSWQSGTLGHNETIMGAIFEVQGAQS